MSVQLKSVHAYLLQIRNSVCVSVFSLKKCVSQLCTIFFTVKYVFEIFGLYEQADVKNLLLNRFKQIVKIVKQIVKQIFVTFWSGFSFQLLSYQANTVFSVLVKPS